MSDTLDYKKIILENINNTLKETNLPLKEKTVGKVRDTYRFNEDELLIVTSDRQSAFDRILATVPFKGAVLNLISGWWFNKTKEIVANHLLSIPHPNVSHVIKCDVFPIEVIVRGYITGTTSTSLWTHYQKGERNYCGNLLKEGLRKNEKLDYPIVTPTTKETLHDRPISAQQIVAEGHMSGDDWAYVSEKALKLFKYGQQTAQKHNLILVDTKYEFGKDKNGVIRLIDEVHTPDSSRYWLSDSYKQRFENNEEPQNIDKEFLRLWFSKECDPYNDEVLPKAPTELIGELSFRYIQLYEMITNEKFPFERILKTKDSLLSSLKPLLK
ncbi:MAG: phosphoribosylaminoimidazolesuccinocarboxamide synthase [Sphaerochaetaceae bacterium]